MRQLIFWTLVFLSGCSGRKEASNEPALNSDSTVAPSSSITVGSPAETFDVDFPLDSLLKFDSEEALKIGFGHHVKRSVGYYPEGMGEYPNRLLFQGTKNEVEFVWRDDSVNFSGLVHISIAGNETDWKTEEGITLGTNLRKLEQLNQKPFTFYGLGWDYSGMTNWEGGHLDERKVYVSLDYPGESIPSEYEGLLGDHKIPSDSVLAQKANPVVCEITMHRNF